MAFLWNRFFGHGSERKTKKDRNGPRRCPRRSGHVSVCIGEELLVWGGYKAATVFGDTDKYLPKKDLWVYDSILDCWHLKKSSGQWPPGTSGASCVLLIPYLYVIGGHTDDGHVGHVYRLHLRKLIWEEVITSEPGLSPCDKFATWVYEERIYCFGGYGMDQHGNGQFQEDFSETWLRGWKNHVMVLDTVTCTWSNPLCKGHYPLPRAAHAAALVDDRVYIFGGRHVQQRLNDLHCLDLKSLTWSGELTTGGPQPCGRSWHSLSPVNKDQLLLFGGFSQDEKTLDDVWLLRLSLLQWSQVISGNGYPRLWHTANVTDSGNVLVFGGCMNNILSHQEASQFSEQIIKFQLQPKRLERMCLETVFLHEERTKSEWELLPLDFQVWLAEKSDVLKEWCALDEEAKMKMGQHILNGFTKVSDGLPHS